MLKVWRKLQNIAFKWFGHVGRKGSHDVGKTMLRL